MTALSIFHYQSDMKDSLVNENEMSVIARNIHKLVKIKMNNTPNIKTEKWIHYLVLIIKLFTS